MSAMRRTGALAAALLVASAALAGCTEDAPAASGEPAPKTASERLAESTPPLPARKTTNERWHFHDHWKGEPTITLLDVDVNLSATTGGDGLPAIGALLTLPDGTIVPPEAGSVTLNVTWAREGGLVNLTFRPADSNSFFPGGDASRGAGVLIGITESMADVPHRSQSLWAFNLTAKPGGEPAGLPDTLVHVTINATIGRPLFIDPPHLNWWLGGDVIPLVTGVRGRLDTAATPAGNLTLPGDPDATTRPAAVAAAPRVPATDGRIVPEGAKSIVVLLNFTSEVPNGKLLVRYREANLPSEGAMTLAVDGGAYRVFTVPVDPDQTDTTYSNRTTWEFQILPEGGPASAFRGEFTLYAWVAKLGEDEAIEATVGTG